MLLKNIYFIESTEVIKVPEKVDDFLLSLFKALDRQKSKDDRKSAEKKVNTIFLSYTRSKWATFCITTEKKQYHHCHLVLTHAVACPESFCRSGCGSYNDGLPQIHKDINK